MITIDQVRTLDDQLAIWTGRDHADTTPLQRQAADAVVELCDQMLQALYRVRGSTVAERRECDGLYQARVERLRAERIEEIRVERIEAARGPQVPPHVMAIIDEVLPQSQAHGRWLDNRGDLIQ
jgi:hypothetical protein